MAVSAAEIAEKAIELGYDKCGMIPVEMMRGCEAKLEERMEHFPETRRKYEGFRKFAYPEKEFPWAKAIVIVSFWYGKYRIPAAVRGHIAKYYLTDGRQNPDSQGYKASAALEKYLRDSGLRVAFNRDFALTALRWAAMQAGIGIVRKNNFFYTEKGSYQYLEAFLIDEPLQLTAESTLRPCAESCDLCIRACPTHSLEAPYTMNRNICVSNLTTWDAWDMRTEPRRGEIGPWIFGCDVCPARTIRMRGRIRRSFRGWRRGPDSLRWRKSFLPITTGCAPLFSRSCGTSPRGRSGGTKRTRSTPCGTAAISDTCWSSGRRAGMNRRKCVRWRNGCSMK